MLPQIYGNPGSEHLLTIFSAGIVLAFCYTASPVGLKYIALGDICIFLCFGPLLMECTALMTTGQIHSELLLYATPVGLLTETILHSNNMRDIKADKHAGAITLATLLGFDLSYSLFVLMFVGAYLSAIYIAAVGHWGVLLSLVTVPLATGLLKQGRAGGKNLTMLPEECAKLHLVFGITLFVGVYFTNTGFLN